MPSDLLYPVALGALVLFVGVVGLFFAEHERKQRAARAVAEALLMPPSEIDLLRKEIADLRNHVSALERAPRRSYPMQVGKETIPMVQSFPVEPGHIRYDLPKSH